MCAATSPREYVSEQRCASVRRELDATRAARVALTALALGLLVASFPTRLSELTRLVAASKAPGEQPEPVAQAPIYSDDTPWEQARTGRD